MFRKLHRIADAEIDSLFPSAIELLKHLVATNSVNPLYDTVDRREVIGGETSCARAIGEWLAAHGFAISEVSPDPERVNVVARRIGSGGGRSILLNGHVDTVLPFRPNEWKSGTPWTPLVKGNLLYGLGATDMKGGLVAASLASAALARTDLTLKGDLQLHAVVGEETGSHDLGTSAVLSAGYTADAAIVVEPSSGHTRLAVCPVSAGALSLKIAVRGKGTHVGNRGQSIRAGGDGEVAGVNAIEKLLLIVNSLQRLEGEWGITKRSPLFPAGHFSMTPAVFHGDVGFPSVGFMAEQAYASYLIWYPPDETMEQVCAEIEQFIHHTAQLDSWLRKNPPHLEWFANWPAATTSTDHPLVKQLAYNRREVLGERNVGIAAFGAVSDASHIEAAGIPAIVMGPGDLRRAHAMDEFVDLNEIKDFARILVRTIIDWCEIDTSVPLPS